MVSNAASQQSRWLTIYREKFFDFVFSGERPDYDNETIDFSQLEKFIHSEAANDPKYDSFHSVSSRFDVGNTNSI